MATSTRVRSPEPRDAQQRLKEFTSKDIPVPSKVHIGDRVASIVDLVSIIQAFRQQKWMIEHLPDGSWPSVRLRWNRNLTSSFIRWVPLDLGDSGPGETTQVMPDFKDVADG